MAKTGWKDAGEVRALTFDCYGTLIDWDGGIRQAMEDEGITELLPISVDEFLERREAKEVEWEKLPYRHYREILALSMQDTLRELEVKLDDQTAFRFAESIKDWPPFEDTVSALRRLGSYWPLSIISNVERSSLRQTVDRMGIPFAEMITAEDVRAYKPAAPHFEETKRRLGNRAEGQLHVAGSLYHDIRVAHDMGVPCVWVNRKGEKLPSEIKPKAVVKNLTELCEFLDV